MEEVLALHPDVAECAVIGVDDELKGQVPVGLLVLKRGVGRIPDEIVAEVVQMVRQRSELWRHSRLRWSCRRYPRRVLERFSAFPCDRHNHRQLQIYRYSSLFTGLK